MEKFRRVMLSRTFIMVPSLICAVGIMIGDAAFIPTMATLAFLIAGALFLLDDLLLATGCALDILLLGTLMLTHLSDILPFLPLAAPMVIGFFYHLIRYRRRFTLGPSFYAFVAMGVAALLGGVGYLSVSEYFSPVILYYTLGLSVLPPLLYCLYAMDAEGDKPFVAATRMQEILFAFGFLCVLAVGREYVGYFLRGETASEFLHGFSYRNTLADLLIATLPATVYFGGYVLKKAWQQIACFLSLIVFYAGLVLTTARTALLFGTVLFVVLLIWFFSGRCAWRVKLFCAAVGVLTVVSLYLVFRADVIAFYQLKAPEGFISPNEARAKYFLHAIEDFRAHPIFGTGFGDLHEEVVSYLAPGCMSWYHVYVAQIFGSMGIVGILAYLGSYVLRGASIYRNRSAETFSLALSYLGLLLYSQTDPGEFIPFPFAALAVILFVLIDEGNKKQIG